MNASYGKEAENDEEMKSSSCASKETVNEQEDLKRTLTENPTNIDQKHETVESLKLFENQMKKIPLKPVGFFG